MSRCPTCEKNARRNSAQARENGQLEGAVKTANGRVVHFSEEERRRRSELAKKLHAEGRLGGSLIGARGGRAANRHRITDAVLDHFRQPDKQEMVIKAVESAFKGKNKHLKLAAYRELRQTEKEQEERLRADRGGAVDPDSMTDDQLVELIQQGLQSMISRGDITADVELGEDAVQEID